MQVTLEVNPDEALALIQVLERDILFRDLTERLILDVEKARHEWANDVRNMAYARAENGVDVYVRKREEGDESCDALSHEQHST